MNGEPTTGRTPSPAESHEQRVERVRLTRILHDLDWDLSQRAEAQDYLIERLQTLGGPVSPAEAFGEAAPCACGLWGWFCECLPTPNEHEREAPDV